MARTVTSTIRGRGSQVDKNLQKRKKGSIRKNGAGDAPNIHDVSIDSEPGDRSDEYRRNRENRFIDRLYKFAATNNVSATIMIAQPGSSEILIAGVGYTLGKIKRRRQLYKFRFVPPNTKGKYILNMEVSKKLLMSESIVPTKIPQPKKTEKSQETEDDASAIINEIIPEVMEVATVGGHGDGPNLIEDREVTEHGDVIEVDEEKNEEAERGTENESGSKTEAESGSDKSKDKGVVAGPSRTRELEIMLVEAAMDTSCSSETIGLTKPKKLKPLSRGKKKVTYERKLPIPGSIDHNIRNRFQPPTSKHTI